MPRAVVPRLLASQRENDGESALMHFRARSYDPRIGRWTESEPILERRAKDHYVYVTNAPTSHRDPTGRIVERNRVATLQGLADELNNLHSRLALRDWEKHGEGFPTWGIFLPLSENIQASGTSKNRYLYTAKGGWVDLKHLSAAAAYTYLHGRTLTLALGLSTEKAQSQGIEAYSSGFGFEDLPSNKIGADFLEWMEKKYGAGIRGQESGLYRGPLLGDALRAFVNEVLGGAPAPPVGKIDQFNMVKNLGEGPVFESDLGKLPTKVMQLGTSGTREFSIKTSGSATLDDSYLKILQVGLANHGTGTTQSTAVGAITGLPSAVSERTPRGK